MGLLLKGITLSPLQSTLIAKDAPARIRINTPGHPENAGYEKPNERTFSKAVAPYLRGDWADGIPCQIKMAPGMVAYSGAEHAGTPKLPNITIVPNWPTQDGQDLLAPYVVLGCTMGHYHPKDPSGPRIQEVYEFLSHGLLVTDREDGMPEIWVAKEGGKVAVPDACHMTLYNLGEMHQPLITLDFANPARNPSDKKLIESWGPILLIYYDPFEVTFTLNRLYVNNRKHSMGVKLDPPTSEDRRITIPRAGRLDLGRFLHEQLTGNTTVIRQFARLGLQIKPAFPEAVLTPVNGAIDGRLSFARPLAQAAVPGTEVYTFFFPAVTGAGPVPRVQTLRNALVKALARKATSVKRRLALQPLNRPLVLLVQGAGDWVENAFRRTFMELAKENYKLSVFYADDTSWRGESPTWTSNLQPWEVYLDKANARDLVLYKNILARVDAVFIVTPDFTHSALAQECIRRRVPLILIEKPFDSHCANIESLLHEMGLLHHHGAVLGVDHYMFYAADVQQMMPVIERHLGGAVARVAFYMTEPQPIERERERSLQFGLMLDMLCHMLGMLTWFGAVQTVDDIRVVEAGQYKPLISQDKTGRQYDEIGAWYRRETYVRVQFTYEDHAGNRVPCLGVIGKGCAAEVKYLEVTGVTGNAIRIDLGKAQTTEYPADSIFFLADPTNPPKEARQVVDPYNPTRLLYILPKPQVRLDRDRYKRLIVDLIEGTDHVITNALLLDEAYALVNALDRIWEAIQTAQPQWRPQALGAMRPV